MISLRSIYLTCALLALFAIPGFSTTVLYADWSSWQTAVTGTSTVNFDPVGSYNTSTGFTTGLTLPDNPTFIGVLQTADGTTPPCSPYTPGNCSLQVIDHTMSQYFNFDSVDSLFWGAYSNGNVLTSLLQITWPTPVTAVGLNLATYGGSGASFNVQLNGDSSQVFATAPTTGWPNSTFFGLTSTTPISSLAIYLPAGVSADPLLNSFTYGTAQSAGVGDPGPGPGDPSDTPEISTFLSIASGLIGMAGASRKFRSLRSKTA